MTGGGKPYDHDGLAGALPVPEPNLGTRRKEPPKNHNLLVAQTFLPVHSKSRKAH